MAEVRITHLHPRELREFRDACPVAWLPLGTIEWHGRHLPLGFDGVKAEALCIEAAREIGGVVFPPQYYGDHRGIILETSRVPSNSWTFDHGEECCRELGVSSAGVRANAHRDHARGAGRGHVELLERSYWMLRAYGFTRIVALAGHYPNATAAEVAADHFHAKQTACRVISGHEGMLGDGGGDHAGAYETSQLMYLLPGLVQIERLSGDKTDEATGIGGEHPRRASAARGREIVEAFIAGCRERLGEIPATRSIQDPDEDGMTGDWQLIRTGGNPESIWS